MKRSYIAAVVMACLSGMSALPAASPVEETARPDWCRKGWVCVPSVELVEDTLYKIDLREKLALAQSKNRRFGWSVGCGLGVAVVVDEDYSVNVPPAGLCGVIFDFWRW